MEWYDMTLFNYSTLWLVKMVSSFNYYRKQKMFSLFVLSSLGLISRNGVISSKGTKFQDICYQNVLKRFVIICTPSFKVWMYPFY